MGSVGLNSPALGAFQSQIFPRGLDLGRCVIQQDVGVYSAAAGASWEQGMLLALDSTGALVKATGKGVFGVAKWNLTQGFTAVEVDEVISFGTSGGTATLAHTSNVTNLQARSAPNGGGSLYSSPGDYTLSGGTFTHAGGGSSIPVGSPVYVTYTWTLLSTDFDFEGRNFFNFTDDVTVAQGRCAVINDAAMLFTTMYDTSKVYTINTTAANLYCGGSGSLSNADAGLLTNDSSRGDFVGVVTQLPTASDPFLGFRMSGDPVART